MSALWTPNTRASGFLVDAKGLIATNQRVIGTATSVEVQLTPAVKVAARVLAADSVRDVAILRIDPKAARVGATRAAGMRPGGQPLVEGQRMFTIGAPLREQKGLTSGTVGVSRRRCSCPDLALTSGSAGGPVFTAGGIIVGITSIVEAGTMKAAAGTPGLSASTMPAKSSHLRRRR